MALKKSGLTPVTPVTEVEETQDVAGTATDAQTTPDAEVKTRVKDSNRSKYYENFKKQGKLLREEEKKQGLLEVEGSMSDKVKFLFPLGNPAKVGTRTEKGVEGIDAIEVVGYEFEALADLEVPVIDRTGIPKNNIMGYKDVKWVTVKAGEKFQLTRAELGLMIPDVKYAGVFSGNPENIVELQITVSKASGGSYQPLTVLKTRIIDENTKPIKANIVPVALKKEGTKGTSIKDFEVIDIYKEKFGYIFEEVQSLGRSSRAPGEKVKPGQTAAELAAAMRAFQKNTAKVQ